MATDVLARLYARMADNNARRLEALTPQLVVPHLNGAFNNYDEEWSARTRAERIRSQQFNYVSADTSFFEDVKFTLDAGRIPSVHMDREPAAFIRLYIYLYGSVELMHMWEWISPFFDKASFRKYKTTCRKVEGKAMRCCLKFMFSFVARTIARTGGMNQWLDSKFQDRYKVFAQSFDEYAPHISYYMNYEERKSVGFDNMYSYKPQDADDIRASFRKANKIKFLRLAEACFQHCFKHQDGRSHYTMRQAWKGVMQDPQIMALGIAADPGKVPARPFGQEGQYERKSRVPYESSIVFEEVI